MSYVAFKDKVPWVPELYEYGDEELLKKYFYGLVFETYTRHRTKFLRLNIDNLGQP